MLMALHCSFSICVQMAHQDCSFGCSGQRPEQVLPSRRPKWPTYPQVKHLPELTGAVPGCSGYGVDSVMWVPNLWVLAQSACWA